MRERIKRLFAAAMVAGALCFTVEASAADVIKVNNIFEVQPYLKQSNVHVVVEPGTYKLTAKDYRQYFKAKAEVVEGKYSNALFLVEGNNSYFDFTGVIVEVPTELFNIRTGEFNELHIIGSDNVVKGLTLIDIGNSADFPKYGCVNVLVDGARNRVEEVEIRSKGSYPYGYGEVFGKGGPATIRHKKHSACLVRGDYNHILNCRIIHRAYGHFLFMQAAHNPTIEGCYIEGEMITTDGILKEKGTGSPADQINFKTVWGYKVPKGYTLSTGEDGIRTYKGGNTIIDGVRYTKRPAANITVKDCVVKHARGGVALTLSNGTKHVENVTLIGCQGGFATGSGGKIINCRADVAFGAAFSTAYENDKNITVDITIMPYEGEKYVGNGPKCAAMIMGSGHNITLRRGEGLKEDQQIQVFVGGNRTGIGNLDKVQDYKASNFTLNNETGYPVLLGKQTTGIKGYSVGKIYDNGTNNVISQK